MVQDLSRTATEDIVYPDSDGQPMADNTKQFRWIVTIKENLELLFADRPDVFVAGDLLWYPVEGKPEIRRAPDAMVVFGRPKGDRGSYRQWVEDDIAPQVVFEVLSPGDRPMEMLQKQIFYERYGVEEYYVYDPDNVELAGFIGVDNSWQAVETLDGWVSPRLGIKFLLSDESLELFRPDGKRFSSYTELGQRVEQLEGQLASERDRNQQLADKLKELGIDPDSL
ncbi:MAG: Uma2 family endonuclease [Cyanobacteria bacterium J06648_16]